MSGVVYLPYEDRQPDNQYQNLLRTILEKGKRVRSQQEEDALRVEGHMMRFPLANGFPAICERDVASSVPIFQQAIAELTAFLNGAHTQEELKSFGCRWWSRWVTKEKCEKRGLVEGDLGPGSYGPAWTAFPTVDGGSFNQIQHVIEQIRELPHLRTHFVSSWIPQYAVRGKGKQQKVVVVPCHGIFHVLINEDTRELTLVHVQRSADTPVGLPANMIQYAALTMMIAHVTGFKPAELVHFISDAHIFIDRQREAVEQIIATTPQRLPTVTLVDPPDNIFAFRPHHFKIEDYHPQLDAMVIGTPV